MGQAVVGLVQFVLYVTQIPSDDVVEAPSKLQLEDIDTELDWSFNELTGHQ